MYEDEVTPKHGIMFAARLGHGSRCIMIIRIFCFYWSRGLSNDMRVNLASLLRCLDSVGW